MTQYDPASHHTPPGGHDVDECPPPHAHSRRYDRGLIPPPISIARGGRFIAIVVATSALAIGGSFFVIGKSGESACEQREEMAHALRVIIQRSNETLPKLSQDGTLPQDVVDDAIRDNARAIHDLTFPPC